MGTAAVSVVADLIVVEELDFWPPRQDDGTREYVDKLLNDGWSLVGRDPLLMRRGRLELTVAPAK